MELLLLTSFCIIIVVMKRYFAFILSGCVAANATALSLQDALDMAMANNSKIKAEKAKVDIAESGKDEAFARFLPTVSLSAGITKIDDPINIDLGRIQQPLTDIAGAAAYSKAYLATYNGAYAKAYQEALAQAKSAGLDDKTAKAAVDAKAAEIWKGVVNSKDANDAAVQMAESKEKESSDKIKNSDFKRLFINRSCAMWKGYLNGNNVSKVVDQMVATIPSSEKDRDLEKFKQNEMYYPGGFDWKGDRLKEWARSRDGEVVSLYKGEFFKDDGDAKLVSVKIKADGDGSVLMEGMHLPGTSSPTNYSGEFFNGMQMELTAVPTNGAVFKSWSGCEAVEGKPETCRATITDGLTITASFK